MSIFKTNNKRLQIGEGRISGYLSIFLGICALLFTVSLYFPNVLTTSDFRHLYSLQFIEVFLLVLLILCLGFALTSFILRKKADIAAIGVFFLVSTVFAFYFSPWDISNFSTSFTIGLDWLVLDIFFSVAIFIPLELFLPKRMEQTKFHPEWRTDLAYFIYSHLLVQILGVLIRTPNAVVFSGLPLNEIHEWVSTIAFPLQLFIALLLTDLFQWTIHFLFHKIPFLWRFHAVHHSVEHMDWLAGSRIHFIDLVLVRSFSLIPIYLLGFSNAVFLTYLVWVSLQAVLAHSNTRLKFGVFSYLFVTPQYHHWHHSANPEYYDRNFAIHFPFIDMLFGTYLNRGNEWPEKTGLSDTPMPKGILKQTIEPFRSKKE